ncbi:MAG: VWA domain-containing protein [Deltaproteobacteria bacterium]|nr:VWA domain-containing protein [Deltaproteobacteria bacterium]
MSERAASSDKTSLQVHPVPAHSVLLADKRQRTYLKVNMTGLSMDRTERPPVNVSVVLDRSGSMAGEKLSQAKQAAGMVLAQLRSQDVVSVVTYDSGVDVPVPATDASEPWKLTREIEWLQPGGRTALYDGVQAGAKELRKHLDSERINRIVLLSDGLANVGPSSPESLASLGDSLGREGIAVTTIGLGLDYSEQTMTALAERSEGNHFFARDASDLRRAFATEFGAGLAVVARDVDIRVELTDDVRLVRVLNYSSDGVDGQVIKASRKQLYGGMTAFLLLELEVEEENDGDELELARVEIEYTDMRSGSRERVEAEAKVRFSDSAADVLASESRDVMVAVAGVLGNRRGQRAVELYEQGRTDEARREFAAAARYLEENGQRYGSEALLELSRLNHRSARHYDRETAKDHYKHKNLKSFGQGNMGANAGG